ncbi:putative PEP-CTERM system TPR-repeat lipoprotein [Inhella inkyongensis]|uniref:Putative PEP-CTERM system TPR-repeat lipoprotein n=1 Tax=Inhella inkyongensis TaxID=392593 RepID=A0A840SAV5_9BURK|nr:XrtA/PEP-CTERM system TPR-repeat protein PrsT [Inhella inkyongensis]MBB5205509.1 putative PEP-CTERM system TPR-repeat lipoprotein [Inhella inkyongensis]
MKLIQPALSAVALALALGLQGCGGVDAEAEVAAARKALVGGEPSTAVIHLKNVLEHEPSRAEARLLLGQALLEGGDAQAALVELQKASELGEASERVLPLQARALLARREFRRVLELDAQASAQDPKAKLALQLAAAQAHAGLGQPEEARKLVTAVLQAEPSSVDAQLAQIRLLMADRDLAGALAGLDALLKADPKLAEAWRLKAEIAGAQNQAAQARRFFESAVEHGPKSLAAHSGLVGTLLRASEVEEAARRTATMRKAFGGVPEVLYFEAAIAVEKGEIERAFELSQQLLKMVPDDTRALLQIAQVEYRRGNLAPAEAHLSKLLARNGNFAIARGLLAQIYLKQEDPRAALEALEPLLAAEQTDARVHALAGEALARLGEVKRAEAQFKRAVELDPKDSRSRILLALREANTGSSEKGIGQLQALAEASDNPVAGVAIVATLVRKGDYAGALKAIDQAAPKLPGAGMADSMRAGVYLAQGQTAQARKAWEESLRKDPKYLPAALQLARLDRADGQPAQALARLQAVAKADPSNLQAQLGWLAARNDANEKADDLIAFARQIVRDNPKSGEAQLVLVRLVQQRKDTVAAIQAAQEALAQLPTDAGLLEMLGSLQMQGREHAAAHQTFKKLVLAKPNSAAALMRQAEAEVSLGDLKAALSTAQRAQKLQPDRVDTLRMMVGLEAQAGNEAGARRLLKEMQGKPGREALAFALEGDLEYSLRNWDAARAAYKRALERGGQQGDVAGKLHNSLLAAGKSADAESFARQWLADHPQDWAFRSQLGLIALAQGQAVVAQEHYQAVAKAQPGNAAARNNLAWLALQAGDLKQAQSHIESALALRPGEPEILDTQAQIQSRQGQHEAALQTQRRVVALDSRNPARRVALAKLLIAAKQTQAARDELQAVQKLGAEYGGQAEVRQLLSTL